MKIPQPWRKPIAVAAVLVVGAGGYVFNVHERDKARRDAAMYAAMLRSAERSALAAETSGPLANGMPQSSAAATQPYVPVILPGTAAPPAPPQAATSTALPDGTYACTTWIFGAGGGRSIVLGYVEISGGTYRGPSQTPSGPFQPLPIDGAGEISWSPNFSSLAAAGSTIGRSYVSGKPGAPAFTVEYRNASGSRESMDCVRE